MFYGKLVKPVTRIDENHFLLIKQDLLYSTQLRALVDFYI